MHARLPKSLFVSFFLSRTISLFLSLSFSFISPPSSLTVDGRSDPSDIFSLPRKERKKYFFLSFFGPTVGKCGPRGTGRRRRNRPCDFKKRESGFSRMHARRSRPREEAIGSTYLFFLPLSFSLSLLARYFWDDPEKRAILEGNETFEGRNIFPVCFV